MSFTIRYVKVIKACGIHLLVSAGIAALAAILVFKAWFPFPFRELAGGTFLFLVVIGVDLVCGPLLTLVLFKTTKSRRELIWDLSLVGAVQLSALFYGLYSISLARPVAVVYEVDRFVMVTAAEIESKSLMQADKAYQCMPWWGGPWLLSIRSPRSNKEVSQNLSLSLQGHEPSTRPDWWWPYEPNRAFAQVNMQPLIQLYQRLSPLHRSMIDDAVQKTNLTINKLSYLPLVSQKSLDGWIVLLDGQAYIVGYAPISGWE